MRRFLPKSLIGQLALVMAAALLIAQAINFSLLFSERQRNLRSQIEGPAIARFIGLAQRAGPLAPAARPGLIDERGRRRGRYSFDAASIVPSGASEETLTGRLRDQAAEAGLQLRDLRAMTGPETPPAGWSREGERPGERDRLLQTLRLSVQFRDGSWLNGRMTTARPDPWIWLKLAASTLLIYLILLAGIVLIALRLGRPLKELTAAAGNFEGRGEAPQVTPRGPADVSRAILAFNAMSARVSEMLEEKDRMLGAIGHDLRTPLASLRIRLEGVEPAAEREKMIATIAEMTALLEETLELARAGRAAEPLRAVDVQALADAVVEEFRTLGQPVEMGDAARLVAEVRPNLLRRALRNLIENGVRHGGGAAVVVRRAGEGVAIAVSDDGPGIPEDELTNVLEPFVRLESSRSRETGGSGLGLTLARGAAQAHGGRLALANRPTGGLVATLFLPMLASDPSSPLA